MTHYLYRGERLPVAAETDVLVVGAGPAGVGAAIRAGRCGARTLLLEQSGSVGGMATVGMMSHFTGRAHSPVLDEMLDRQERLEHRAGIPKEVINPEVLKLVLLEMLEEAGVSVLFYVMAGEPLCEGGTLKGVLIHSKAGREVVLARLVIDCTGDGDIAARAGADFVKGRESDGRMQPATLMFKVGGVDDSRAVYLGSFESTYLTPKGELQALARDKMPPPLGHVLLYRTSLPGVVTCNITNVTDIDGTDPRDLTRAEILCRKQMFLVQDFLRTYVPGYEHCFILSAAAMMGIRETRHILGECTLTEQDISTARQFDDWVVKDAYFNFDVHNLTGAGLDKTGAQKHFRQKKGYTIPYGCFIPKKLTNLLVAGRSISGTHLAHSNFRAMPICVAMGEAVGAAAALALRQGVPIREVPVRDIQAMVEG
ncbi:MAG: FAD-dependent oxidoreductase [Eubacteriales bacterium]